MSEQIVGLIIWKSIRSALYNSKQTLTSTSTTNNNIDIMKIFSSAVLVLDACACTSLLLAFSHFSPASAMTANPSPFAVTQPDGRTIDLKVNGDDNDNWMSDMEGYTVLRDPTTGFFVYAEPADDGQLQPSEEAVFEKQHHTDINGKDITLAGIGKENQNRKPAKKQKNLRPSKKDCTDELCSDENESPSLRGLGGFRDGDEQDEAANNALSSSDDPSRGLKSTEGTLRNLVVLMRWADHADRVLPTTENIDVLMNQRGPHQFCPTGSVRDVFLESSYGALNLESVVTPWIPINDTEIYFANGNRGLTSQIWGALRFALQYLDENNLVQFSDFDVDQDGKIDSITFLHSGYGAEWGGIDSSERFYLDRIWSHQWAINRNPFTSSDGVMVQEYHISPALWATRGSEIGRIGVIAHEMGRFLGMPDLYDKNGVGKGIGSYDLMANSWGWDGSQFYPPHMSAWTKQALGWLDAVEPALGLNTIEASEVQDPTQPQLYKITEGFPEGEYLLIENRQRLGYDSIMPQGGLAIWHVDMTSDLGGRRFKLSLSEEGHPGQENWPNNGKHYGVALLQADGYFELERGVNVGDMDDLFHARGLDEITPCLEPGKCQYPNTDAYQGGVVTPTNVFITDISVSGRIMTFNYNTAQPQRTSDSTSAPTSDFTMAPTYKSTTLSTNSPAKEDQQTICHAKKKICSSSSQCCSGECKKKVRGQIFGQCL